MVREMIGGCCVCLDERGWNENPLVYCDGSGCTIAVHQGFFSLSSLLHFLSQKTLKFIMNLKILKI